MRFLIKEAQGIFCWGGGGGGREKTVYKPHPSREAGGRPEPIILE